MIEAKPSYSFQKLFSFYLRIKFSNNFHKVEFNQIAIDPNKSLLILANHISWWDGFLLFNINRKQFNKNFHVMMMEEQLKKLNWFRKLGAYSIKKNTKEIIISLNYTSELLKNKKNMVLLFPSGEIHSQQEINTFFGSGTERILNNFTNEVQVLAAISFIDYGSNPKPSVITYLDFINKSDTMNLADSFKAVYLKSREKHLNRII